MTNEQHNRYIAYSFFGFAGTQMFWLVLMLAWFTFFLNSIPVKPGEPDPAPIFGIMMVFVSFFFLLFTVPVIVAGWAMLKKKPWARIAAIIGAIAASMSVPFGTAACVYALWFWMGDNWKEVYAESGESARPVLGLESADEFQPADEFRKTEQDWLKEPPDWR